MTALRLFRWIEPYFCGGLLDDPLLLIRVRPTGRSLLFDCGQLQHLAKRVLRSIDVVFVSHAHMDHFMGFDHLVRHTHVSPRPLDLFGPPGFAQRVASQLGGYDWNLSEEWWRTVHVHEIHADRVEHHRFAGARGFRGEYLGNEPRHGEIIYSNGFVTVAAQLCDHGIPVLVCRLTEQEVFTINPDAIKAAGLHPGPWLCELKRRWRNGELGQTPLAVSINTVTGPVEHIIPDTRVLYRCLRAERPAASIGYVTDIGFTNANRQHLRDLLAGVSLLCCECTFLAADEVKARKSMHLCSRDVNRLVEELHPKALLPMHLSKAYGHRPYAVYDELTLPDTTRLLRLPDYLTPRPKLLTELPPAVTG